MPLEWYKAFFEIGGVVLLFLTFVFGAGALIVSGRINRIQAEQLRAFQLRIETEQQKTSAAQKEAAEAQLALRQSMLRAFKRTGVRTINLDAFRNALRGTPKGNVELWVTVEDGDAHQYGLDIQSALRLSGWNVSEIKRLPPETKPIWESMVVRCGKLPHWDLRSTPRTNGEALQKALMMGTDWNNNPLWMEPDQTLSDGNFVIEVHPQTPTEKQYNSSEQ